MGYLAFLKRKMDIAPETGFDIDISEVNPALKSHQKTAVVWGIKGGRRAIFKSWGLGKTIVNLEICRIILKYKGGKALIVLPLGVRQEFLRDAVVLLGMKAPRYVRNMAEVETEAALGTDIMLTNYERVRDGDIDPTYFTVCTLDEAAVLRSYGSDTYQTFMVKFKGVKYKFVFTATPSPNRLKELIHYAAFLEIMDSGQALTRFFQRDSTKANNLTLYPHREDEFWLWCSSWALWITKPSDLGSEYSDEGYDLPPLEVRYHEIPVQRELFVADRDGQIKMQDDEVVSLPDAMKEKRRSINERVAKLVEVLRDDGRRAIEEKRIHTELLQGTQRGITRESKNQRQEEISGKQGEIQRKIPKMEGSQSRAHEGTPEESHRKNPRIEETKVKGMVLEQQGESCDSSTQTEIKKIWINRNRIQQDFAETKWPLRNLSVRKGIRKQTFKIIRRSRPCDRDSERTFVPEMQRSHRNVQGRPTVTHEGSGLPDQYVIWCDLNEEQRAIEKALKKENITFSSLYGHQDIDTREQLVMKWKDKETSVFLSKTEMYGAGVNLQQCHTMIYAGIDYKFEEFIQGIHRVFRFLQKYPVTIHIIHTSRERRILQVLLKKWEQHNYQTKKMTDIIKKYGLSRTSMFEKMSRTLGVKRVEVKGKNFTAVNNDCILELEKMPDNTMDLWHTSIPFCYDEQTQVLTRRGWIGFDKLRVNEDEVATVGTAGCIEYQRPSHVVWEQYEGEMISFWGRSFNLLVTPSHRMYVSRRRSPADFKIVTAEQITADYENTKRIVEGRGRISNGYKVRLVPAVRGEGERPEKIVIPALPEHIRNGHGVQLSWIKTEDFMRLAGWYLSEGHADSFEKGRSGGRMSIGQSPTVNPENYKEIEELFNRIGLPPSFGKNQITVWCRNLAYFMRNEFGYGEADKCIPRWVLELHPDLLTILRDTMMKGDGAKMGDSYASISPKLRDAFQEICLKTGWRAGLTDGKVINLGSTQLCPEIRQTPKRVKYSGMIGCATVPNGIIIVRRNGQPCISGNSNHYEYANSYNDMGFNPHTPAFFEQMDFLSPNLLRTLKPGRVFACHVKDRVLFGNATGTGMPTMEPFHALCIQHYMKHGFQYFGMITVVTDVVRENNQTYRLGWSECCKDGTKMGVGCPEYILLFRKLPSDTSNAYADIPVTKSKEEYTRAQWQIDAHGFWRTSGDRFLTKAELERIPVNRLQAAYLKYSRDTVYNYREHIELAKKLDENGKLPASFMVVAPGSWTDQVWDDILRMKTLNAKQTQKRLQNHICPLQIDIAERIINRYSNPGELVGDMFGGLMTVPKVALDLGRKGWGCELASNYFRDGVGYLQAADEDRKVPSLFDFFGDEMEELG